MDGLKSLLPVSVQDADPPDPGAAADNEDLSSSYFSGWMGETEEPDPWIPSLTRKQRLLAFFAFSCLSIFCFTMAMLLLPFIVLKARKFALLFSMGSLSSIISLSMLRGPSKFMAYMFSREKMLFSAGYFISLFLTLYCAMGLRRTVPTIFSASVQFAIIGQYILGYIPGGMTGVRMLGKMWWKLLNNTVIPFFRMCLPRLMNCF